MLSDDHRQLVLHARGISDEVIDGSGRWPPRYDSYGAGDVKAIERYLTHPIDSRTKGKVTQSGGVIINRFPMAYGEYDTQLRMLIPYTRPEPQLRPDRLVWNGKKYVKYFFIPNGSKGAKQIDVHPMARSRIKSGTRPVFFVLEGSLKADALLSKGVPAFSVPGVTMWEADDLETVVPYLEKAPAVFVVTDSNWRSNPDVWHQALKCAKHVSRHNAATLHLAPPPAEDGKSLGVDDFLAGGGALNGLEVVRHHLLPTPEELNGSEQRLLTWLVDRGTDGRFQPSEIAADLDYDHRTITRGLAKLSRLGTVELGPERKIRTPDGGYLSKPRRYSLAHKIRVISLADLGVDLEGSPQRARKTLATSAMSVMSHGVRSQAGYRDAGEAQRRRAGLFCRWCSTELSRSHARLFCTKSCKDKSQALRRSVLRQLAGL